MSEVNVTKFLHNSRLLVGTLLAAGALSATGCGPDIVDHEQIDGCGENNNSGLRATSMPGLPGYDRRTDPILLEREYRHREKMKNYSVATAVFHSSDVGLGEFMCTDNGKVNLTAKALEFSRSTDSK